MEGNRDGEFRLTGKGLLLADCGGAIRGLAMAVPGGYLAPCHGHIKRALGSLIASFDAAARVTVLVRPDDRNACSAWLTELEPRCAVTMASVPSGATLKTLWIQDRFLCRGPGDHRRTYLFPPSSAGENMATWLAAVDGSQSEEVRVALSGGNCLVGEDYWLVGADSVAQSVAFLPADRKNRESAQESIAAIDRRRLEVVGYSYADLKNRGIGPCHESALLKTAEIVVASELKQPIFHLDLFLTITGETVHGKPLLLVGEPVSPGPDAGLPDRNYSPQLAAVCCRLRTAGFEIMRNPVAVLPERRSGGGRRFWRSYNNVILQNRPDRVVWLPQFADVEWPELRQLDEENTRIWRDCLGFAVRRIDGWGAVAALGAGVRCVVKVTERDQTAVSDRSAGQDLPMTRSRST